MSINKAPKFCALMGTAVGGWLLPIALDFSTPIAGFSLVLSFGSCLAVAVDSRRESQVSAITQSQQKFQLEKVAYELSIKHEAELQELREMYGFGDDLEDHDDASPWGHYSEPQPALNGAHLHQARLAGGTFEQKIGQSEQKSTQIEQLEQFDLDWLLRSPNLHLLITGDTGDGKTTLTRWIAQQFNAKQGKVYDPDYDGSNWGFPAVTAPLEDYTEIRANMRVDLQEFERRQPNDPANPKTVFIVEEMPSTIPECAEDGEKWLKLLLRRGRKRNLFVIGVSQDRNADSFKLKSAGVLSNFTVIYLGGYGELALDRVRNRAERHQIRQQLRGYPRPALVQFKGRFYPWNVPDLSSLAQVSPQTPTAETRSTKSESILTQQDPNPETLDPVTLLNRALQAENSLYSDRHYEILHWIRSQPGQSASARDIQRQFRLTTAEDTKTLLHDLECLEFGECQQDDRYPGRLLFRAY
jgi:hypothetical protein